MRSLILLIVIAIQALIGQTIPIKFLDHLSPEKSLVEVSKKKDISKLFENVDPEKIAKGDPKAIFDLAKASVDTIGSILTNKNIMAKVQGLSQNMGKLGAPLQIACLVMDIYNAFQPEQPDPQFQKISDQITALDSKLDAQHKETMHAFKALSAEVCEGTLSGSRTTLESLSDFIANKRGKRITLVDSIRYCDNHQHTCVTAFNNIVNQFPRCLDKIIAASVYKGPKKDLLAQGSLPLVQPQIEYYIDLMVEATKNIGVLQALDLSNKAITSTEGLKNEDMDKLKEYSDNLQFGMQKMLKNIYSQLSQLTTYEVEDWSKRNFGKAWGRRWVGHQDYFSVKYGYAIKGFWRGQEGRLNGIKFVLIGKGLREFVGWQSEAVFNKALRDNNGQEQTRDSHMASCPELQVLKGLGTKSRFHDQKWLEDINIGQCIRPLDIYTNKRQFPTQTDCHIQEVSWKENQWVYCEEPGYYLSGIEKFGGPGPGLETISGLKCCMPLMPPFENPA